jgi:hypothetical protein
MRACERANRNELFSDYRQIKKKHKDGCIQEDATWGSGAG